MNHEAEGNTKDAAELNLGEGETSFKLTVTSPPLEKRSKSTDEKMNTGSVPETALQPLEERPSQSLWLQNRVQARLWLDRRVLPPAFTIASPR
jgi:hypothetical protein